MPLRIVLLALSFLLPAALAQNLQNPPIQPREVRVLAAKNNEVVLARRDRTGAAAEGRLSATALLAAAEGQLRVQVQAPQLGDETQFTFALILWDDGEPPYLEPSVLYATARADETPSLDGRVFLGAAEGVPRIVSSRDVWQSLGARAGTAGSSLVVSIPLNVIGGLCPNGLLLDARLQTGGAIYSYGPSASWFEPPEPTRALRVKWDSVADDSASTGAPVKALADSLAGLPIQRGPQLWEYSRKPLPLDQDFCGKCVEVARSLEVAGHDEASGLNGKLERLASSLHPEDLAWQQAMLGLQSTCLDADLMENSVEAGLRILEADGTSEATVVRSLRMLATALMKANVRLAGSDERSIALKPRFLKAASDRNFRAAYGADLLMLQQLFEDASVLLESVRTSGSARPAVRAHAMFRLQQLSARSLDWPQALNLAEQIQAEVPFDIVLRGSSLQLLSPWMKDARASGGDLSARLNELHANLKATVEAVCRRYFPAGSTPSGSCPVCVAKEEPGNLGDRAIRQSPVCITREEQ